MRVINSEDDQKVNDKQYFPVHGLRRKDNLRNARESASFGLQAYPKLEDLFMGCHPCWHCGKGLETDSSSCGQRTLTCTDGALVRA